jgi:hypothetical protein
MTNQQTTRQQANGRQTQTPATPPAAAPPSAHAQAPAMVATAEAALPVSVTVNAEKNASLNLRFDYRGGNFQLTLRDDNGTALLDKIDAVLDRLERMGATLNAGGAATRPSQVAPAGTPSCPDGHGPMKASDKKPGTFYCPHVIAESAGKKIYCQQKSG